MQRCGKISRSKYTTGKAEDKVTVTFVNDIGGLLYPAYIDSEGQIQFLAKRSAEAAWDDRTYLKTNWIWFSDDRKSFCWSASSPNWSDKFQLVSTAALPN